MSTIRLPYFDNAEVELRDDDGFLANSAGARQALEAFLALTSDDRLADSRHVYAYYRDVHEVVGGEDWMDAEMGVPDGPEDIWRFVQPRRIFVWDEYNKPDVWHVAVEANCGWEDEHGLLMVWLDGKRLNKVGGYDGHPSNEHAYDDPAMAGIVYASSDPKYVTRIDDTP